MTPPAAILFDLDDTLLATSGHWRRAESRLLAELGHAWSPELAAQYKGMNTLDVAACLHRLLGPPGWSVEDCQRLLRGALIEEFESAPPAPMPGVVACVRRLAAAFPCAVASGSPLEMIRFALGRVGLRESFACLVSSESVARGKPAPDVFLAAAAALGVDPAACLVFEDTLIGVQAARAAGMTCYVVPSSSSAAEFEGVAHRVFGSLAEVGLDTITII